MRAPAALLILLCGVASAGLYRWEGGVRVPVEHFELAGDVGDPLLALIVGLLDIEAYGGLAPAQIDSVVIAHGGSKLPHRELLRVDRAPAAADARSTVDVALHGDLKLPVPYSILGYNPGSMAASENFRLREWILPRFTIHVHGDDSPQARSYRDLRLYGIESGWIRMDVDWWLDKLMGSRLDDTQLVGVALIREGERRLAVAFGYTQDHKGRTGVFDLAADEVVFPAPRELLVLGRELRAVVESRMAESDR